MPKKICKVLSIDNNQANVNKLKQFLLKSENSALAEGLSFKLTNVVSLSEAMEKLTHENFDVILLELMLPDSQGIDTLIKIKEKANCIPIVFQTLGDDEKVVVKAFQIGADGYLQKKNLDPNLLIYSIRLAIERKQYITKLETTQQQRKQEEEFQSLELLANSIKTRITARMFGSEPLKDSMSDIFLELVNDYSKILELALEQQAYKVEHNLGEKLRKIADKLGFLKASPRDVVDIHTKALREKSKNVNSTRAQVYVDEGRLMVLELMGYLTSYYRKYYIGLSNINISSDYK